MRALDRTALFSRALAAEPDRLHFAAHSHHLWPDATLAAQERAWLDAAEHADEKWSRVFGEVLPKAQANVASSLGVDDPTRVVFSANTHDLIVRLFSALPAWGAPEPMTVLSTDAEFHSFTRQMRRSVEAERVRWTQVPAEPFETLPERFRKASEAHHDLVFASQVLFSSSHVFSEAFEILAGLPEVTLPVVDGYHGWMAVPTNLAAVQDDLYYTSGGYKYAMTGEGASFLVAPHGRELRPEITGWFAGFSSLEDPQEDRVGYDEGAARFFGATFEPTPLYRLNAVFEMLRREELTIEDLHGHSAALQAQFLEQVAQGGCAGLRVEDVLPSIETAPLGAGTQARRGNFLTFRRGDARELHQKLLAARVITDVRGDRLRFGFGLYQCEQDVARLAERLRAL